MAYRGAHQRRQPLWTGRVDLNLTDIALGFLVEVLLAVFLVAAVFAGR